MTRFAIQINQFFGKHRITAEPVIQIAVEPKTKGDQDKMGEALHKLGQEDPSLRIKSDEETGQTLLSGMGELHLEIIVDRMKREFNVEANVGKPQVAYRETITQKVEHETKFVRQPVVVVSMVTLFLWSNPTRWVRDTNLKI